MFLIFGFVTKTANQDLDSQNQKGINEYKFLLIGISEIEPNRFQTIAENYPSDLFLT